MAREAVARPRLRYIRLDRQQMPTVYPQGLGEDWNRGFREVAKGRDVAIVACGYLTHRALRAAKELTEMGMSAGAIDLFRLKPLDAKALIARLAAYRAVVTIEEHILDGGFGSVVAEALSDAGAARPIRRLGMNDGFEVVNGTRDELHAKYGIDVKSVVAAAAELARR
jgi:transketolase